MVTGGWTQDYKIEKYVKYLDSGARSHTTEVRSKFRKLDEMTTGLVKFGDGSMVKIKGTGSIAVKCKNGDERFLNGVYFIPNVYKNIISSEQLSKDGNKVVLGGELLWVHENGGKLLMKV